MDKLRFAAVTIVDSKSTRRPRALAVAALTAGAVAIAVVFGAGLLPAFAVQSYQRFHTDFFSGILLNPWFFAVIALVCWLEWLIPAKDQQSILSRGLGIDLVWIPLKLFFHATIAPAYVLLLHYLYSEYLSFLTITWASALPVAVTFVLALLWADFLFYVSHFVRHKVRPLWHFHAVHHSQRQLNFFTEYRTHPIDDLGVYTIGFIPLFMFAHTAPTIVAIVWIRHWHTRIYHSNIRSNFGLLRYVLVTPQSHRVHHSFETRHLDKNFGLTFSIWDHLFGTQYRGYDEYPDTGIDDPAYPSEQERKGTLSNVLEQLIYPFAKISEDLRVRSAADKR